MSQVLDTSATTPAEQQTILGQPRGLATLFLTEMWERFTYYGMRAILILFMVAAVSDGGLGIDDKTASSSYGLYIAGTYFLNLLGGWIADRLIGQQRAVVSGGVLIMIGNALLAVGNTQLFFLGLVVVVFGVGLLKPNISAIVAQLYPEGGSRRDAGFSIFYMGINTGSLFGSFLVPIVAQHFGWHWGFALPALGMLVGLFQFMLTRHFLGRAGLSPADSTRGSWLPVIGFIALIAVVAILCLTGAITIQPAAVSDAASWLMIVLALGYFVYLLFFAGLTGVERHRVWVMIALFAACAMFWAGYEQTGASLNLFAARYTDLNVFGWNMPAGALQAVNPFLIIVLAPVLAGVWLSLGRRNRDLSAPAKFAAGLMFMGLGFLVMYFASRYVVAGEKVLPTWLVFTYFLHTVGELCLSPVGLSSMTKLAPPRFVGQVMGMWFLATALGNNLAGQLSAQYDATDLQTLPGLFLKIFWWGIIGGAIMVILTPILKRLMAGVK